MSRGGGRGDLENIYQIAAWAGDWRAEQSCAKQSHTQPGTERPSLERETQALWPTFPAREGGEKNGFLVLVKITTSIIQLEILIFPAILVNQYRILATF